MYKTNYTFLQRSDITNAGFTGFLTIRSLWDNHSFIPDERGVYLIINPDISKQEFLMKGSGGFFKDKDPNISVDALTVKWNANSQVLYIGQGGGNGSAATLRKRLKQYLDFGKGKPVGHYGGRLIWQPAHHPELLLAWKATPQSDPREEEKALIRQLADYYGKLPFANLVY